MRKNTKEKLEKLKKQQDVLKSRIQLIEGREKQKQKKIDTRQKILVGSYFIDKYKQNAEWSKLEKIMDDYLVRDSDRKIFSLPIHKEN